MCISEVTSEVVFFNNWDVKNRGLWPMQNTNNIDLLSSMQGGTVCGTSGFWIRQAHEDVATTLHLFLGDKWKSKSPPLQSINSQMPLGCRFVGCKAAFPQTSTGKKQGPKWTRYIQDIAMVVWGCARADPTFLLDKNIDIDIDLFIAYGRDEKDSRWGVRVLDSTRSTI